MIDLSAGAYSIVWDGRDNSGGDVASGIYLYKLRAGRKLPCQVDNSKVEVSAV